MMQIAVAAAVAVAVASFFVFSLSVKNNMLWATYPMVLRAQNQLISHDIVA